MKVKLMKAYQLDLVNRLLHIKHDLTLIDRVISS